MPETFYFYDLETSGLDPRNDRIMQFAGMRTDKDFNPIGEAHNILIKIQDDTLPSPSATIVTGITPNATLSDGITEREFCQFFMEKVALPNTTIMGYNSIRFDDEFIRHTLWRNFYDAYEWQWKDGRSRWDLMDVVRMTRALRPDGLEWPMSSENKPTNRLEFLTKANHIAHEHAHDALSDVEGLASLTKLISEKQPQLFEYLYKMRDKKEIKKLVSVENPAPFVYTSGRYPLMRFHTTVAYPIAEDEQGNIIVYDLHENLDELLAAEAEAKAAGIDNSKKPFYNRDPWERDFVPIVKKLQLNRCPAIAPLSVLEKDGSWERIDLSRETVDKNLESLKAHPEFIERILNLKKPEYQKATEPENALYDGFLGDSDRLICSAIHSSDEAGLRNFDPKFQDERLPGLFMHYKAKNFPDLLTSDELVEWQSYRLTRLRNQSEQLVVEAKRIGGFIARGEKYANRDSDDVEFLLQEVMLWCESLQ